MNESTISVVLIRCTLFIKVANMLVSYRKIQIVLLATSKFRSPLYTNVSNNYSRSHFWSLRMLVFWRKSLYREEKMKKKVCTEVS